MIFLSTSQKLDLVNEFKQRITDAHFYPTPVGGKFNYTLNGVKKYFTVTSAIQGASLLHKHGFITGYSTHIDGTVSMFEKRFEEYAGPKGEPVQIEVERPVSWGNFSFLPAQVKSFAAYLEMEESQKKAGLFDAPVSILNGPVIRMFIDKASA